MKHADSSDRIVAFLAYLLPVIGWLYALIAHRKNAFVVFHTKQAIGLVLFLLGVFAGWAVIAYLLAMIPFVAIVGVILFSLVIAAFILGAVVWIIGMANALRGQLGYLPIFGHRASSLPF
jgi:uncharacterized membrane protein